MKNVDPPISTCTITPIIRLQFAGRVSAHSKNILRRICFILLNTVYVFFNEKSAGRNNQTHTKNVWLVLKNKVRTLAP